jgi:tRNA-2-methylthio-N6-dimethylallyladenosine synthase
MKKLFVETFGCAMNVRDTEHIIAELSTEFELSDNPKDADLILINTCSVREKPVHKLFSEIGQYAKLKKDTAKIGVCGCTASHLGREIIDKAPSVNFVLGARNTSKISKIISQNRAVEIDIDYDDSSYLFKEFRFNPYKALINISIGCDKSCTFCIVPQTRGDEVSIPKDIILNEVKKAVDSGAKEILLLGQNVNSWGKKDGDKFTYLLRDISKIDGLERIRFISPHPLHTDDEFLEEYANNPKIAKNIHLPLQSGSTKILKEMKRGYSKEWFLNRVQKIRTLSPQSTISTDIIVAFPNESEADFLNTLDVMREANFEFTYSFKYSPRPNTPASNMKLIEKEIAEERLAILQNLQDEIHSKACISNHNRILEVLVEEKNSSGYYFGKSSNNFGVKIKSEENILGKLINVRIISGGKFILEGEIA